ncbi:hypothetical protein [Carboxylicivirga taeanensis]|uniref:hypothetical protein n=1 Tax=Carboxylicivirga taeanensis TaxID=1416875 RepID=UPI003F6DD3A7
MKTKQRLLTSTLLIFFVFNAPILKAQTSKGAACPVGRSISVYNNKYAVEQILPLIWENDINIDRQNKFATFYLLQESLTKNTTITKKWFNDLPIETDLDSYIENEVKYYKKNDKRIKVTELENILHNSVSSGKAIELKSNKSKKAFIITYIKIDNTIIKYTFLPKDNAAYEKYRKSYEELITSIKVSKI